MTVFIAVPLERPRRSGDRLYLTDDEDDQSRG